MNTYFIYICMYIMRVCVCVCVCSLTVCRSTALFVAFCRSCFLRMAAFLRYPLVGILVWFGHWLL